VHECRLIGPLFVDQDIDSRQQIRLMLIERYPVYKVKTLVHRFGVGRFGTAQVGDGACSRPVLDLVLRHVHVNQQSWPIDQCCPATVNDVGVIRIIRLERFNPEKILERTRKPCAKQRILATKKGLNQALDFGDRTQHLFHVEPANAPATTG